MLNFDAEHLHSQLRRRDPNLVVFMFGGNDMNTQGTMAKYREEYTQVIRLFRAAKEPMACLVMAPLDHGDPQICVEIGATRRGQTPRKRDRARKFRHQQSQIVQPARDPHRPLIALARHLGGDMRRGQVQRPQDRRAANQRNRRTDIRAA